MISTVSTEAIQTNILTKPTQYKLSNRPDMFICYSSLPANMSRERSSMRSPKQSNTSDRLATMRMYAIEIELGVVFFKLLSSFGAIAQAFLQVLLVVLAIACELAL